MMMAYQYKPQARIAALIHYSMCHLHDTSMATAITEGVLMLQKATLSIANILRDIKRVPAMLGMYKPHNTLISIL